MPSVENDKTLRFCLIAAGLLGSSAVALGAFHAHGMRAYLEDTGLEPELVIQRLDNCATGVRYQMYGALALLGVGAVAAVKPTSLLLPGGLVVGTLLFSGSLYGIVFLGKTWLGAVAPIGGAVLILAWLAVAISARSGLQPNDG